MKLHPQACDIFTLTAGTVKARLFCRPEYPAEILFVTGKGGGEGALERIRAVQEGKEREELKDRGNTRCYFFL